MSYSEYEAIESTWLLPNDMIESIKRAYPELALIDMSSWTYGDYKSYCKQADYEKTIGSLTANQLRSLESRDIQLTDLQGVPHD